MFNTLRKIGAAAIIALGSGVTPASAASVDLTFDEIYRAGAVNKHFIQRTGIPAAPYNIFAYDSFSESGPGTVMFIQRANEGWGVANPAGVTQYEAGRMGGGETLVLDFLDREITLSSIGFSTFDAASTTADDGAIQYFDLYVRALGSDDFVKAISNAAANGSGTAGLNQIYDFTGDNIVGSAFALVSLSDGPGSRGFRMASFAGTASVPGPGTAAALGGALVFGGAFLRRRKAKAA